MYITQPTWHTHIGKEYDWDNFTDAMGDVEQCLTLGALSVTIRKVEDA